MSVFPDYEIDETRRPLTQSRLNRAKFHALRILRAHEDGIKTMFLEYMKSAYKRNRSVSVNMEEAYQRIRRATLGYGLKGCWGESDDETIEINAEMEMNDHEIQGTILHEALHYIARRDGKWLSTKGEHEVMSLLGDDV